ncbi:J domain-containing protein [Cyanobium sp. NIES-981]|uniref:J domain-containing protein n=1 Tax=Cyanobium sp. NIES-981 TaxID=1851505 RepID=UPI0007DE27C6|nr:J domain-containing protein [Cyanobium sp. NIES-981]SBO44611.1 DnaJ protein [Cyanobium sp. NIES-981]
MPLPPFGASPSHYTLLQLPSSASPEELRQAFRSLSKLYHPDTTSLPVEEAAEAFQRLKQAYAVLSNPESRRRYDAELLRAMAPVRLQTALPADPLPAPQTVTPGRPMSGRRSLSGGEWLALLLLALALVLSLVLGVGLALARGMELARLPSWWPPG